MGKVLFIFYLGKSANNFTSRGWIFSHFKDLNNENFDFTIHEGIPAEDYGASLHNLLQLNKNKYKKIYLIIGNPDMQNEKINWIVIRKYVEKVILFPVDAISVLRNFRKTIIKYADIVWCPHLQVIKEIEKLNKPYLYIPYASIFPKNIKCFEERSDSLFFQGTAHGLRKSLIIDLSNNSNINIKVQGNGWEINNSNKIINNSIKNSINYYFNPPSKIFNKLIKSIYKNKYFLKSLLNYPKRLISENVPIKNGNILIIPSSINEKIDNYKFTLGINYLFSNEKYFSYRLRDFESPAHGSCHLTQTDPNLEKIFLPNISMLYYRDKQDLIEMVNYYLNTKVGKIEAKKIGLKAREVAKNNTWGKRLEEIYKYFEEDK